MIWLLVATMTGMSLWFMTAAVLPDIAVQHGLSDVDLAWLSSAVPVGFASGAMMLALSGVPDRFDPRRVFAICAVGAAVCNLALLTVPIGGGLAIVLRFITGWLMAGTWPLAMKIAVGLTRERRGTLMGTLVAALVVGQAVPYFLAWLGGANWQFALISGSSVTVVGAIAILLAPLGPFHAQARAFRTRAIALAWTDRRIRAAILAYLGHMWEFIAFWAWIGTATAASFSATLERDSAVSLGKIAAVLCILAAAPACIWAGGIADRIGKEKVSAAALFISGSMAVLTAITFGGPVWLTFILVVIWGAAVVPDSPQFSALIADHAPPELSGSLLTFQASLGFLLTALTTQVAPVIAGAFGWPTVFLVLALGPAFGLWAMRPLFLAGHAQPAKEE